MPASASERTLARQEFDGTEASMSDAYLDAVFDEATTDYPNANRVIVRKASYYTIAVHLRNRASRDVDYKKNESDEKLSQRFVALDKMVAQYKKQLDEALLDSPAIAFAVTKRVPSRTKQFPN